MRKIVACILTLILFLICTVLAFLSSLLLDVCIILIYVILFIRGD